MRGRQRRRARNIAGRRKNLRRPGVLLSDA